MLTERKIWRKEFWRFGRIVAKEAFSHTAWINKGCPAEISKLLKDNYEVASHANDDDTMPEINISLADLEKLKVLSRYYKLPIDEKDKVHIQAKEAEPAIQEAAKIAEQTGLYKSPLKANAQGTIPAEANSQPETETTAPQK